MASVKFYINSKKAKTSVIIGKLFYNGTRFVFSTQYSIKPDNWSHKTQRVSSKEKDADNINSFLAARKSEIINIHDNLKRAGKLSAENLDMEINGKKGELSDSGLKTFYQHIEETIHKAGEEEKNKVSRGEVVRSSNELKYKNTFKRIKATADKFYNGRELGFDDIDMAFYDNFVSYLKQEPQSKGHIGLSINSIGGEIKRLKRFMKTATTRKLTDNFIFKDDDFKAPSEHTKQMYLDENEVNHLFDIKNTLSPRLKTVCLNFLIGARTGLRVSDYKKCIDDAVKATGLICIDNTQKTGEPVFIPLHWQVKTILEESDGVPLQVSDQELNRELKVLGKLAGFDKMVWDTRKGRNKPIGSGEYCHKYELLSTHTARRSCATNMYLAGFDLYFIQGILGHTKLEQTIKYLGVTRELIAQQMVNHPFFLQPQNEASNNELSKSAVLGAAQK